MSDIELLARVADLEVALRIVVAVWIVSVVLLGMVPDHDCPHCLHCQGLRKTPRCAMCYRKHDPTERCQ